MAATGASCAALACAPMFLDRLADRGIYVPAGLFVSEGSLR